MKKALLLLTAAWLFPCLSGAQDHSKSGIYNYTIIDNRVVVTDLIEFSGLTDEQIFVNALLYALERSEKGEEIREIDFGKRQFTLERCMVSENSGDIRYYYSIDFKLADGILAFLARDISCKAPGLIALGSSKGLPFEKLNPEKRPKQQAYLEEYLARNTAYLGEMANAVNRNAGENVTHWSEIASGEVVKGMNETEVRLSYGKPQHVSLTGERCRMLFKNNIIVILESGIVANVIK